MLRVLFKAIVRRLLLIGLGICLGLLVLECALQIGAALTGASPERRLPGLGDRWRILALGDSNTYGLYLDDTAQAYPKVLESLWNADPLNARVEVLNLGFPGTNSSRLVKNFRNMLWAFRPDMVTVMIGANDYWTLPVTLPGPASFVDDLAAKLWKISRVYRFLYMVRRALQVPDVQVAAGPAGGPREGHAPAQYSGYNFELGWVQAPKNWQPPTDLTADLKRNAETLAEQAKDFGATLVFLTYPSEVFPYGWANATIRDAARNIDAPLIDLANAFRPFCPGSNCADLFPDHHPTAAGHERAARILMQQLMRSPVANSSAARPADVAAPGP